MEKSTIIIEEWLIDFNVSQKKELKEKNEFSDRLMKTIQLLDKMEKAAVKLNQRQIKMNGSNLGKAFDKPVTAPAISDALYNHKKRIIQLFHEHPEKWLTVKNSFRPLKKIADN